MQQRMTKSMRPPKVPRAQLRRRVASTSFWPFDSRMFSLLNSEKFELRGRSAPLIIGFGIHISDEFSEIMKRAGFVKTTSLSVVLKWDGNYQKKDFMLWSFMELTRA